MTPVTELFQRYRIASRMLWNVFFIRDLRTANWDERDRFDAVRQALFEGLVLGPLRETLEVEENLYPKNFSVVPTSDQVRILIERPREGDLNHYWDHPVCMVDRGQARMSFIDYFDWNPLGYVDFKYVRARIEDFAGHPDLQGRQALLEVDYVAIEI